MAGDIARVIFQILIKGIAGVGSTLAETGRSTATAAKPRNVFYTPAITAWRMIITG
jgi:hypothetical protein